MQVSFYITKFQDAGTDKHPRGWYVCAAEPDGLGGAKIRWNVYNFSNTSRGEAVEKFYRQHIGLTRDGFHRYDGLTCLDYLNK